MARNKDARLQAIRIKIGEVPNEEAGSMTDESTSAMPEGKSEMMSSREAGSPIASATEQLRSVLPEVSRDIRMKLEKIIKELDSISAEFIKPEEETTEGETVESPVGMPAEQMMMPPVTPTAI